MALAELRSFDPSFSIVGPLFYGNGAPHLGAEFVPLPSQYSNARSRDATDFAALGRVELDARTQSSFGTLRSFIRVNSFYGSNGSAALGSLGSQATTFNTTAGTSASRETTLVSRAFVQFVGLTAGRTQSMFDFYADAINFKSLRGSNAIVTLFAYTATLGNGFSGTVSFEDQPDRRAAIGSTIASTTAAPIIVGGVSATSFQAQPAGSRVPEIVGNLRFDQPWGAVQLSAAARQVRASLFGSTALATPPTVPTAYAFPALTSNSYGFALQGGLLSDADYISPDDRLWLQVAYEKGAFGYIAGNNLAYSYGSVNQNRFPVLASRRSTAPKVGIRKSILIASSPEAAAASANGAGTSPALIGTIGFRTGARGSMALIWRCIILPMRWPGLEVRLASRTLRKAGSAPTSSGRQLRTSMLVRSSCMRISTRRDRQVLLQMGCSRPQVCRPSGPTSVNTKGACEFSGYSKLFSSATRFMRDQSVFRDLSVVTHRQQGTQKL